VDSPNLMRSPDEKTADVLRQMEQHGFDFSKETLVKFSVAFEEWPPSEESIDKLRSAFSIVELQAPSGRSRLGYATIHVTALVTYDFMVSTEKKIQELVKETDESCTSWSISGKIGQ